jgi:hypothetical protein
VRRLTWAGGVTLSPARLAGDRRLWPVRIAAGALGPGLPASDLWLSPRHRLRLTGWRAELMFAAPAVLVAAGDLVNDTTIRQVWDGRPVTLLHLMTRRHAIILAEGVATETLDPAYAAQAEPDLARILHRSGRPGAALPALRPWEGRLVRVKGLEPPRLAATEPKSVASASFATPAPGRISR